MPSYRNYNYLISLLLGSVHPPVPSRLDLLFVRRSILCPLRKGSRSRWLLIEIRSSVFGLVRPHVGRPLRRSVAVRPCGDRHAERESELGFLARLVALRAWHAMAPDGNIAHRVSVSLRGMGSSGGYIFRVAEVEARRVCLPAFAPRKNARLCEACLVRRFRDRPAAPDTLRAGLAWTGRD